MAACLQLSRNDRLCRNREIRDVIRMEIRLVFQNP